MVQRDDDKPEWLFRVKEGDTYIEYIIDCGLTYPITKQVIPDTIKSQSDDGYITTRPRFTRRRYTFELQMPYVEQSVVDQISDLDARVTGSEIFEWYNELEDKIYFVRFVEDSRPEFTNDTFVYTSISFSLEEF